MRVLDDSFILEEIPLFAGLTDSDRHLIRERAKVVFYHKGQTIYAQGAPPDAFYCVIVGRVLIFSNDEAGARQELEYLHRGKYFGIISLLTNEPHSVTAQAINDCTVLVIAKDDFDFLLERLPHVAIDLGRTLSRRLKRKDVHAKMIFESTAIAVYSSYTQAGKSLYALNLALSLKKETRKSVIILDLAPYEKTHSLPRKLSVPEARTLDISKGQEFSGKLFYEQLQKDYIAHSPLGIDILCFHYEPEDESCVSRLVSIVSLLVNDYHYLIVDLPSVMDRAILSILNQSDLIHILSSPEETDLVRTYHLIERLEKQFNFLREKIKIIINEYKLSKLTFTEEAEVVKHPIYATLPKIDFESADALVLNNPDAEYAKAVRRISRQVGECLVGLALGVGMGYGFCHLGVLKVIEEEHIPIDVIAGSSIGALIASLWATGKSSSEILAIAQEFKEPKHLWNLIDLTLPLSGFIKGTKLQRFLKKHLGDKTFYDTRLPLKIIASDLKRKEPRIIDTGLLVDAITASCAMPGVFAPFKFKEELLFDGGVVCPLPTEPLLKMGVKKIIAVNVTPSREDILRQYEKLKEEITVAIPENVRRRQWKGLRYHLKNLFKTNILDIIFSSVEILQSEVAKKEGQLADVLLHPDTTGLYWLELYRADEFVRRGEEEARRHLEKIKKLIND